MDRTAWDRARERFGQEVDLVRAGETARVRAFFQPIGEKSPGQVPTALGIAPVGKWLYLGPAEEELEDVETVVWKGGSFRPIRHREVQVGRETLYRWAVCEEMDEVRDG